MTRNQTFSEIAWPEDPNNQQAAVEWASSIVVQALDWTWRGFDVLHAEHLSSIDMTQPLEQLERDLVRHHYVQILALWGQETDGYAAFSPVHEWPEMETRSEPSAKPPSYDMAFVSTATNQRWALAVEAKVLPTKGQLSEYMKDVNKKFAGGVACPLVGEGGMIGYLLCDETDAVFVGIEKRLKQTLGATPEFAGRPHRTSDHIRANAPNLRLHHMLMVFQREPSGRSSGTPQI